MASEITFPFEFRELEGAQRKVLDDGVYASTRGLRKLAPEGHVLPAGLQKVADEIYGFEPRPDDVWVATFPRSGTTVTQELVWLVGNDFDYEGAKEHLTMRFPLLEEHMFVPEHLASMVKKLESATTRRYIKTHLPHRLLNPNILDAGSKVIYMARNPKDVLVSYFHFHRSIASMNFSGDFPTFFDYFINDSVQYAPYWEHVLQGWENRHRPNYLFLFYEDLKKDLEGTIRKVADFMGKSPTDEEVAKLKEHLAFENFQKNPAVDLKRAPELKVEFEGNFVRKGQVKNWEGYFSDEMNEKVDRLIREKFDPVGLKFDGV